MANVQERSRYCIHLECPLHGHVYEGIMLKVFFIICHFLFRQGDCLNAIGKTWHPECFNCNSCGKLFGNSPFFLGIHSII